jgi:hypothetical protein
VGSLGPPRELRVDNLVRAVRLKLEEVGKPAPVLADERRLIDDRCAAPDRLLGRYKSCIPTNLARITDLDDLSVELGGVGSLVLIALPPDEIGVRIRSKWPLDPFSRNLQFERRQVRARKKCI